MTTSLLPVAREALARADHRMAERLALEAAGDARRVDDAETEARALAVAGAACLDCGDVAGAVRHARRAVVNVESGRTPDPLRIAAFVDLHAALAVMGAASSAEHAYGRGLRLSTEGDPVRWRLEADRGAALLLQGDAAGAVRLLSRSAAGPLAGVPVVRANLALALSAERRHADATRVAVGLGDGGGDAWVLLSLATVWRAAGALREAKEAADRAARAARLCGRPDWRRAAAEIVRAAEAH
jgi:hypothetical protein